MTIETVNAYTQCDARAALALMRNAIEACVEPIPIKGGGFGYIDRVPYFLTRIETLAAEALSAANYCPGYAEDEIPSLNEYRYEATESCGEEPVVRRTDVDAYAGELEYDEWCEKVIEAQEAAHEEWCVVVLSRLCRAYLACQAYLAWI